MSRVQFAPATTGPPDKQCRQCGTWLRPMMTRQVGLWPCRRHPGAVTPAIAGAHWPAYACCGLATTMHPSRARQLGLQERDLLGCTPCDHDFAVARPGRPRTFTFGRDDEADEEEDEDADEDAVEATETMPARVVLPAGDAEPQAVALTFKAEDMETELTRAAAADEDEVVDMLLDSAREALWTTYSRPSFLKALTAKQKDDLQARTAQLWNAAESQRGNYGGTHTFRPRAAEQPTPAEVATAAQLAMIESLDDARVYAMRQLKVPAQLQLVHLVKPTPDAMALARIAKAMNAFKNE